jgi:hypothetical protein
MQDMIMREFRLEAARVKSDPQKAQLVGMKANGALNFIDEG